MTEVWKDIDGGYAVSSEGRVIGPRGHILRQQKMRHGYLYVKIGGPNNVKTIHRLVADAFLANPEGKRTVNHINGDKADNRVENLEWSTDSEQHTHRSRVLGKGSGETNGRAKLKLADIVDIKAHRDAGKTYREIGAIYGVSKTQIMHIIQGKSWAA